MGKKKKEIQNVIGRERRIDCEEAVVDIDDATCIHEVEHFK